MSTAAPAVDAAKAASKALSQAPSAAAGKLWPTVLFWSITTFVSLAIIAGVTVGYLYYKGVIMSPAEELVNNAANIEAGTKSYIEAIYKLRKANFIDEATYQQMKAAFTRDMARHYYMASSAPGFNMDINAETVSKLDAILKGV
jgi:hypothetical protein